MKVWAISDLHLSFGVHGKGMEIFGWGERHFEKIQTQWIKMVREEDIVLIAGDISWGMHLKEAIPDLQWLSALPGRMIVIKGNHDFWWNSLKQVRSVLPSNIFVIQNDSVSIDGIAVGGARLWENSQHSFSRYMKLQGDALHESRDDVEQRKRQIIYERELQRLETSLSSLDRSAVWRIALLHFPPTGPMHQETEVTKILDAFQIHVCIYGHLHNLVPSAPVNFLRNNIHYFCSSADFLNFSPLCVFRL